MGFIRIIRKSKSIFSRYQKTGGETCSRIVNQRVKLFTGHVRSPANPLETIVRALSRSARPAISIQSAWDTQCKRVRKMLASPSKLVYQVTRGEHRRASLQKDEKERGFYDGISYASFPLATRWYEPCKKLHIGTCANARRSLK